MPLYINKNTLRSALYLTFLVALAPEGDGVRLFLTFMHY